MTTLQARSWAQVAQRRTRVRERGGLGATARAALRAATLVALLALALAIRVLAYVQL